VVKTRNYLISEGQICQPVCVQVEGEVDPRPRIAADRVNVVHAFDHHGETSDVCPRTVLDHVCRETWLDESAKIVDLIHSGQIQSRHERAVIGVVGK